MNFKTLTEKTTSHIHYLCNCITDRRVGGEGNRQATSYFEQQLQMAGWQPEKTSLSVIDWRSDGATLKHNQEEFEVFSSHYSLGCSVKGKLIAVGNLDQLKRTNITDKIVLLHGEIASEQIMPKNFVFYNPEEHQQVISLLEKGKPKALICATGRNASVAGGVYPFPLFEDGDFNIPSVFMKDVEGEKLLSLTGELFTLKSEAERIPETAFNIVARKGKENKERIVISAHIDTKPGTPGAIDNATGVAVLLLLSEILRDYNGKYCIELVAFNGEDYYAVSGQMKYIGQNEGKFPNIVLNINIDGVGYKKGPSCFSAFQLPDVIHGKLDKVLQQQPNIVPGIPWVQGDHSIFIQFGCPAIAVSSEWLIENFSVQDITHTPKDNPDIVNFERVSECAVAIGDLIKQLDGSNE